MLKKGNSATPHSRNTQLFSTELFNGLLAPFLKKFFIQNPHHYDLRKKLNLRKIVLKWCSTELQLQQILGPRFGKWFQITIK